jgi:hypothetical protein
MTFVIVTLKVVNDAWEETASCPEFYLVLKGFHIEG